VVFATIARADEAEQTVTFIANSGRGQERGCQKLD
jgi:hypothetical protein